MKFNYKFSNLCGSVYKKGNLVFTADGNAVLSPVGNKITVFDLVRHTSSTLPVENRKNIARIALSPNGTTLISVDEDGHALLINFLKRIIITEFHFKKEVRDIKFSPDSQYVAVTHGRQVQVSHRSVRNMRVSTACYLCNAREVSISHNICPYSMHYQVWKAPPLIVQFRPFALHRVYTGHHDDVLSIDWSPDSKFFLTSSRDMTARMFSLHTIPGFTPLTLAGHHSAVLNASFSNEVCTRNMCINCGCVYICIHMLR